MTNKDLRTAKRLREKGLSYSVIGSELGVSDTTIRRWLKKDSADWRDRTGPYSLHHPHQLECGSASPRALVSEDDVERERIRATYFSQRKPSFWSRIATWWANVRRNFATIDEEVNLG